MANSELDSVLQNTNRKHLHAFEADEEPYPAIRCKVCRLVYGEIGYPQDKCHNTR